MKKEPSATELIAEIHAKKGNISAVARAFGVSRTAIYNWMQGKVTVMAALADSRETMLDNAESILYKKALEGSTPELIFFLKTQGKQRGYTEKSEIEHSGSIDVGKLSDEELQAIAEGKSAG